MKNIESENKIETKIHVMPPSITDEDISALFNGILNVVKKKIELENKAEIININANYTKLLKDYKDTLLKYTSIYDTYIRENTSSPFSLKTL